MANRSLPILNKASDPLLYSEARDDADAERLHTVLEEYPARLSPFLRKLMADSPAIRRQYLPSPEEAITAGTPTPFEEGKDATEVYGLERLYRDRVLMTPHFDCPAYCRFCYKKSRVLRDQRGMTFEEIDAAVARVGEWPEVRGVLVTGGDPLMNPKKLFHLLDGLTRLPNITEIRVGTRCLLTHPKIFTPELCERLASYTRPDFANPDRSQYLAVNTHFNHPDELVPEVLEACWRLTSRGITLRNQTVLLRGVNDDVATLKRLFTLLLRHNMIPYYLNHCMPVEGADHLRTSVRAGQDIYRELCTESSTAIPHYVFAPSGGKVHVGPDSRYEECVENGRRYLKVTMPYRAEEFRRITGHDLPPDHEESPDGFIVARYLDGGFDAASEQVDAAASTVEAAAE